MDAIQLLLQRSSMPRLQGPAPTPSQLEVMLRAAGRAPDHGQLTPFRFVIIESAQLAACGQLFARAAQQRHLSELEVERAAQLPLRAPLLIVAICCYQQHDKIPQWEQLASASCATGLLQQAAFAQGLGAIWRTGWLTESEVVRTAFSLTTNEAIIGFVYVGTPVVETPIKPEKDWSSRVKVWGGFTD